MPEPTSQRSLTPTRKVTMAALSGAIATILVGSAHAFAGISFPAGFESALATVVMAAVGWWVTDKAP